MAGGRVACHSFHFLYFVCTFSCHRIRFHGLIQSKILCFFRQMHDEVSETENLRKNLAVERMIVEGCDILLDVNQVFVRQGELRAENTHNHYMFKFKPNANKKRRKKTLTHTSFFLLANLFICIKNHIYQL